MKRVVLLIFLLSGFALGQEPPVYLGGVFNLSGSQSSLDRPTYQGAQLAVENANHNGGLLGGEVQLVLVASDSKAETTGKKTLEALEKQPRISALMGLSDTDQVLAAARVCAEQKRVFLTSGATSPRLPKQVPEYLFLACFGDNVQAAAGADFAYHKLKARRVAVIYDASMEYTRLLHGYFQAAFKQLGGEVVSVSSFDNDDYSMIKLPEEPYDLVYLSVGPQDVLPGVTRLRKLGFSGPIMGGDGYDTDAWSGQADLNDIYFTTHAYFGHDNPNPSVQEFCQAYSKKFGKQPDAFSGLGYDAMNLLIAAVKKAHSPRPEFVLEALSQIEDFPGVTGHISFGGQSHIPRKTVTLMEVEKGHPTFEAEVLPESVPAP